MDLQQVERQYKEAVAAFTENVKADKNVIAVVLLGSLSYDKVWEKSDIDMIIIVRDQKLATGSYCIDQDDIVINVSLYTRSMFVQSINKSIGGLISHSCLSKGKILYTTDDSLHEYFEELATVGSKDMEKAAFTISGGIIGLMEKAEKWLRVKNDPDYARFYLLKTVELIANMEVCLHQEPPTREAIQRAAVLNPTLMDKFYYQPLRNNLDGDQVLQLLKDIDAYLESHLGIISGPVREYLSDGEPKTMTMLTKYFNAGDSHYLVEIMEYLREKGVIEKITQTIRITPKGRPVAEEIAYIYLPGNA